MDVLSPPILSSSLLKGSGDTLDHHKDHTRGNTDTLNPVLQRYPQPLNYLNNENNTDSLADIFMMKGERETDQMLGTWTEYIHFDLSRNLRDSSFSLHSANGNVDWGQRLHRRKCYAPVKMALRGEEGCKTGSN